MSPLVDPHPPLPEVEEGCVLFALVNPDLWAALPIKLNRHQSGSALLIDPGTAALPEVVSEPLSGIGAHYVLI